jgi:hypothetical protein
MKLRVRILAPLALAAFALAACDGTPSSPGAEPTPAVGEGLRFSYSTAGAPTLSSSGVPAFGKWSIARPDSVGGLVLTGFQATTEPKGDFFILQLRPSAPGTFTCSRYGQEGCHGRFLVGVNTQDLQASYEKRYEVVWGSVTITDIKNRVRGSFRLRLVDTTQNDTIFVDDGTINVPYSEDQVLSHGINCWARNVQNGTNQPC